MRHGCVYLVGAGPGDASLLTVRAAELLGQAEVVVHDRLIGHGILSLISKEAERIDVGKSPGRHAVPQQQIHEILVKKAHEGKKVLRLKGGDPFVFGRGGEEAEELLAHGIPFEVVPGVSSAIAVPGRFGIPVTHRDHCTAFHVVTGHRREDLQEDTLDFKALAQVPGTLVFLMGLANVERNCQGLIAQGKDPQTPAAVVSQGYTPNERAVIGTLSSIAQLVRDHGMESPAVLVVGTVVQLSQVLRRSDLWPLQGQRILVPRTREQSGRMASLIRDWGGQPLELPLIQTLANFNGTDAENLAKQIHTFQWIVFTSETTVRYFFEFLKEHKLDVRVLFQSKLVSIGSATTQSLRQHGFFEESESKISHTPGLIQHLLAIVKPGESILLPRSAQGNPDLGHALKEFGCLVEEYPLYRTQPDTDSHEILVQWLKQGLIDWIALMSSSTAESLAQAYPHPWPESIKIACIGPMTQDTVQGLGLPVHAVANQANLQSLLDCICKNSSRILS